MPRFRPVTLALIFICCFFSLLAFSARTGMAAEPVSANHLSISGDTVRLRLMVTSPSPQSLILELYLPPGTQVVATSPAARRANSRSGVVKWLFKGVAPGAIDVSMRVSPASAASRVNGMLRYRLPGGGGMTELRIPN